MNSSTTPSFGLIAWLENTRVTLPLKGVETEFDVRGDLVSVELRQIYHQDRSQPLDVLYTFPLPDGAALYRCEMTVNDRVVAAKVMAVKEAIALAAEKKAAGHRTALLESVRDNLFELALGNLAPGDTVVIRMAWFQSLDTNGSDRSFRIPFCPGVRYIPGTPLLRGNVGRGTESDTDQVPDASRLTPPRIDAFHPDAAWVSIEGRVQPEGIDPARIASPSHTLVLRESDGVTSLCLGDKAIVPDRDFVLRLPRADAAALTPVAWVTEVDGHQYALVRIIAPAEVPATLAARDIYFLVDRSGSMNGEKWAATCRAFRSFLNNLAPQDRAWVTFFESGFQDLAEKPMPPAAILAEEIVQKLEAWPVGGGTELLPALEHVLAAIQKHSAVRDTVIILITDGQVGNESTIIERMKSQRDIRVFCYGIDTAVNDAFLRRLAAKQRGVCYLATPQDDLVGSVAGLAAKLRHPVLTALQPPQGWELPADAPPDLHAGDCLTVSLRRPSGGPVESLSFSARSANGEAASLFCPFKPVTDPALSRLWSKQRIDHLLEVPDVTAAVKLSESANILCRATAWVAWDESERIAITGPNLQIYQPAMEDVTYFDKCLVATPAPMARGRTRRSEIQKAIVPHLEESWFLEAMVSDYQPAPALQACDDRDLSGWEPPPLLIKKAGATGWRDKLAGLIRISIPATILDWLEQWAQSEPSAAPKRQKLLDELASLLATHGQPVRVLCEWIKDHMAPAFRDPTLREALKAFGPEATCTGP